jgi:hypothetical protein
VSGAYFGVAGALRSLALALGLSNLFVNAIALLFAGVASEVVKSRNKSIQPMKKKVGDGPAMYDLMKFTAPPMLDVMRFREQEDAQVYEEAENRPFMRMRMPTLGRVTKAELSADLVKWAVIYTALPSNSVLPRLEDSIGIGVVAGVLSQIVRENRDK